MENTDFKCIDMPTKLSNFQVLNPDFTRCKCNVFYTGKNRNWTIITDNALHKLIERKGYANVPVVGHIKLNKDGKKIMGSHDRKIEITNDGIEEINECVAMGVIPLDANPRMEKIVGADGIEREYFTVDVILWTHYFPDLMETTYSDEIYFNHSMEIRMLDTWLDNQYTVIDDLSLQALCMLGKYDNTHGNSEDNSEPCFEDSKIRRFSIGESQFKQNFELMLEKLKQYESDGTTTTVQNNVTNNNPQMEGENTMDFAKITELLSKSDDGCKYRLLNVTDSKVYALDMENYKPYSFDYAVTKTDEVESTVIDFESKTEMSLSATDKIDAENFDEFSIKNEIDTIKESYAKELVDTKVKEATDSVSEVFQKDYNELKEAFDNLTKSHNILQSKVDTYEKKEKETEIEAHKNEINSLVDSYADKLGKCSAYLVYKANIEQKYSMTSEQVEQDLILMAGRYLTSKENSFKKNFSYNPTATNVANKSNEAITNKYGHLLDKYLK